MRMFLVLSAHLATVALTGESAADDTNAAASQCILQTGSGVTSASSVSPEQVRELPEQLLPNADDHFEKFVNTHARGYHTHNDHEEKEHRRAIFHQTLQKIDQLNAHEHATNPNPNRAVHGITKYADWSEEEFRALLGAKKGDGSTGDLLQREKSTSSEQVREQASHQSSVADSAPCTKNWALPGQVRNQGECGDCWAFSVTEQLRSAYVRQHKVDPGKLSTQFLVDCEFPDKTCGGGVAGCCGGWPEHAMEWIMSQGGIPTQAAYGDLLNISDRWGGVVTLSGGNPNTKYPCKANIPKAVTLTEKPKWGYSESEMASFVCETGSLAIGIDGYSIMTYKSGVFSASSCTTKTDHAVQLIGLNATANAWIVQNSWGPDWGVTVDGIPAGDVYGKGNGEEGGFIFMEYGKNTCGLTMAPISTTSVGPASDKYEHVEGVGGWGGKCKCPSGTVYEVGDNGDACASIACYGGEVVEACGQGVISSEHAGWKVTCAAGIPSAHADKYEYVGWPKVGGWGGKCQCPSGSIYEVGDQNDGCASLACVGGTVVEPCGEGHISEEHAGWQVTCR